MPSAARLFVVAAALAVGCVTPGHEVTVRSSDPDRAGAETGPVRPLVLAPNASHSASATRVPVTAGAAVLSLDPGAGLGLDAAIAATLARHPALQAADREREALLAEARAADRRPNPALGVDLEDFGGTGSTEGFEGAQTTIWIGGPIERSAKRSARSQVAQANLDLAALGRQLTAVELRAQVTRSFWEAVRAQGQLELARASEQTASGVLDAVAQRVEAGRVSPLEQQKYTLARTAAGLDVAAAEQRVSATRADLAAHWGGRAEFGDLVAEPAPALGPASLADLREALFVGPRLRLAQASQRKGQAEVVLAEARTEVDWNVTFGLRRYEETDEAAAVLSFEVPLLVSDRGRDAVEAARARRERSGFGREATALELEGALTRAWSQLDLARRRAEGLADVLLPEASAVFAAVDAGYREGRSELIDLLDAQRTLFQARAELHGALLDQRLAITELERLVGAPLYPGTQP